MSHTHRPFCSTALLWLAAASASCNKEAPSAPAIQADPTRQAPPAPAPSNPQLSGVRVVSTDPYTTLAQLVDAVSALPRLDSPSLERVIGVPLAHSPSAEPDEEYFETTLPSGPVARVEVRTSNPAQDKFELAILEVRDGVRLSLQDFRSAGRVRSEMPMETNPRIPPAGRISFIDVSKPGQKVSYTFSADADQLTDVAISRP
jgi:hypothetical protein